jgi:hypothetical protein
MNYTACCKNKKTAVRQSFHQFFRDNYFLSEAGTGFAASALLVPLLQQALAFSLEQGVAQPALAASALEEQPALTSFLSVVQPALSDFSVTTFSVDVLVVGTF